MEDYGRLIILNGTEPLRDIDIKFDFKQIISFGKEPSNDIVIDDGIVSRVHGYFEIISSKLCVYDNNSTNGIYINDIYYGCDKSGDAPIHVMSEGDVIRIDNERDARREDHGIIMIYTTRKRDGNWKEFSIGYGGSVFKIGRSKNCDIRIENISVSREHAILERVGNNVFISDNRSSNGTYINSMPVNGRIKLNERDVIHIGNAILLYTRGCILYKARNNGVRILVQGANRIVNTKNGPKKILNNANIQIEPNDFVAIIGGSGSGKSTLMNAMSGYEQANTGSVYINSVNLYENYNCLKNTIGYVPQQDIIYENLSLKKMLYYSAKLRMADDVSTAEIDKRIQEVLEMVELTEHQDKMIRMLSGGQKKRASIAVELLGDPGVFFLDEPTSGLDPGSEENLMKSLSKLSKQTDKTIVMVTHTTQNLHLCDKIILMGVNGNICFYGSVDECLAKFGVSNLTEVYNIVSRMEEVEKLANDYYREYGIYLRFHKNQPGKIREAKKDKWINQASTLTKRYMNLIVNDIHRLLIMAFQPIGIGFLIALVASKDVMSIYNDTKSILFALSCAGIWVGLFNSIQEVCKERVILKREYMANLRLSAYIFSKLFVQLVISVFQAFFMTLIFVTMVGKPDNAALLSDPTIEIFGTMVLTTYSSACIGIVISSMSKNSDKAMTVAPIVLIIQLLFSGILFALKGITEILSYATVSRWSMMALGTTSDLNSMPTVIEQKTALPRESEDIFEFVASNISNAWFVMIGFVVICTVVSIVILRNISKDSR